MSDCYDEDDNAVNELMDFAYQGPDNPDQEEANFYFALHEFKSIVERYGIDRVVTELDQETEDKLYWWYYNNFTNTDEPEFAGLDNYKQSIEDSDEVPF